MGGLLGMTAGWRPLRATFWLLEAPDSLAERVDERPAAPRQHRSVADERGETSAVLGRLHRGHARKAARRERCERRRDFAAVDPYQKLGPPGE
jgi:hypothetical protein